MSKIRRKVSEMPVRDRWCCFCDKYIVRGEYYSLPKKKKVACCKCIREGKKTRVW